MPYGTKSKVQKITQNLRAQDDQVRAIYQYLQENTRYVSVQLGWGGWQTFDAAYVEENAYGDCKALTYFMKGMLETAGIESYPALIGNGSDAKLIDEFAAPIFNHVIFYIPSAEMWLECTSNDYPAGYIGESNYAKDVLLITPDGAVLSKTLEGPKGGGIVSFDKIRTIADGWEVRGKRLHHGVDHEVYRAVQNRLNHREQEEYFTGAIDIPIDEIQRLSFTADAAKSTATCTYVMQISTLGRRSGIRTFFPINPFYRGALSCVTKERTHPIFMDSEINYTNNILIAVPDNLGVATMPEDVILELDDFGKFTMMATLSDRFIHVQRTIHVPKSVIPVERYEEGCNFLPQIERKDNGKIVFSVNP